MRLPAGGGSGCSQPAPGGSTRAVALGLMAGAVVCLLLAAVAWWWPVAASARPVAGRVAHHKMRPRTGCRIKPGHTARSRRASAGRAKHCPSPPGSHGPKAKRRATGPAASGPTGSPGSRGSGANRRTITAGSVKLTDVEFEDVLAVNHEREARGVARIVTSPQLQAIAESRVQKMVEHQDGYPGDDVSVDLGSAGLCVSTENEVTMAGPSLEGGEDAPEGPTVTESSGTQAANEEEAMTIVPQVRTDPAYTLIGDAIIETGGSAYLVEDFGAPC